MGNIHTKELYNLLNEIIPDFEMDYDEVVRSIESDGLDNFLHSIGDDASLLLNAAKLLSRSTNGG